MKSMLRLIYEDIERECYERLIEEGRDPIELLRYKFGDVPSHVIDKIVSIDPTKKKTYSQWLLSKWDDESDVILANLDNGRIKRLFDHYKSHSDIQIKDCPSVEEGLERFVPQGDTVLTKSNEPTTMLMNNGWMEEVDSDLANDFDVVFNDDGWVIAVPNTYEADCKLGENMKWCTAGGRSSFEGGRSYYDRYLDDYGGFYYVNFDMTSGESRLGKDYPFKRYQFHFESNQFMDKEDEEVDLGEIDMPQSAIDFYLREGYDTDKFKNTEARAEAYEELRDGVRYSLNDELYLCIEYDEDLEFEEPNESTLFYLYSIDDDRDPICWVEFRNPHVDEGVVVMKGDEMCVLECYKGYLVALRGGRYGSWDTMEFSRFIMLGGDLGVFGLSNGTFAYLGTRCGGNFMSRVKVGKLERMFVNKACMRSYKGDDVGRVFIECIYDGYHGLFTVCHNGSECGIIVLRDVPRNGKYFVIDDNGLIEGEFRSYRAYSDDSYEYDQNYVDYDLEIKLPNGDYLVSSDWYEGGDKVYNIVRVVDGRKVLLSKDWFESYVGDSANLYGVKVGGGYTSFLSKRDGSVVGRRYLRYTGIDRVREILCGKVYDASGKLSSCDLIDGSECMVIGTFHDVYKDNEPNGKVVVEVDDDGTTKLFDYVRREFCFKELSGFKKVGFRNSSLYECTVDGSDGVALFDVSSSSVLASGLRGIGSKDDSGDYLYLERHDGKFDVFDVRNRRSLFKDGVDGITSISVYTNPKVLVYYVGDRYYVLNLTNGNLLLNPNGIGVYTRVDHNGYIICSNGECEMWFINGMYGDYEFYLWRWMNASGHDFDPSRTPEEVLDMRRLVFSDAVSVSEAFKSMLGRILEADRLRRMDVID